MRTRLHRLGRSTLALAALALFTAGCGDVLTGTTDSSSQWDGYYNLTAIDGKSVSRNGIACAVCVDAQTYLRVEKGIWRVTGKTVQTEMYTRGVINGREQQIDDRFWPEKHTGTIEVNGNKATITLDTGSKLTATLGSTGLTYASGNREMRWAGPLSTKPAAPPR